MHFLLDLSKICIKYKRLEEYEKIKVFPPKVLVIGKNYSRGGFYAFGIRSYWRYKDEN